MESPQSDLASSIPSTPSSTSTSLRARCEPDPLDPEANICLAKVTTDDRQGISHFFGRNKKATSSIPEDMFPLLCRTHYQEKQYRWKDDPTAFAAFQCDCILKTLERMTKKTYIDAGGVEWPYWCGFELQTQKPNNGKDDDTVPQWLLPLCQKEGSGQDFASIGDRDGVRYSFQQIETIVKAIKTWCLETNTRLPAVEALPITVGMVDEADIEEAKKKLKNATRDHTLAASEVQRLSQSRREITKAKRQQLRTTLQQTQKATDAAQSAFDVAQKDSEASRFTVPGKRQTKKTRTTVSSPSDSIADTDSLKVSPELDMAESESLVVRKKHIILKYDGVTKHPKMELD
jgi:hypothetical protein